MAYYVLFLHSNVHFAILLSSVQALIALKKGAQLLKYGRKGKPKFYPFRLSNVRLLCYYAL